MTPGLVGRVLNDEIVVTINVVGDEGREIGHLWPITKAAASNRELIQKLTDWRNRARIHFFSQFTATYERTHSWLKNVLLPDEGRLLFMINSNGKSVGHLGFRDLHDHTVELDNLIRGEIGGHPQLIYHAEVALINWMFQNLGIDLINAWVLAHNAVVSSLHKRVGFEPAERVPLLKVQEDDTLSFEKGDPNGVSPSGLFAQRIFLTLDRYRAVNSNGGCDTK